MNWYKTAQLDDDLPEWNFPEADHDYDPAWDYMVDIVPDQELFQFTEKVINEINTKLVPQIGIGVCKAGYIKEANQDYLARYINGTQPNPVFVIDLENIKTVAQECAKDYNCDPQTEAYIGIRTTLFHELGHAIQEWMDMDFDENEAEDFGIRYQETGEIWRFWEEE
tara:strand:+ start:5058 stop:5558 length:501 start_codon:yes stop_codon:yes gene_type:complete